MSKQVSGPLALVILDGWGITDPGEYNGISIANTPNYDMFSTTYPFTTLEASGEAVGLPVGQMGNSEVGHTTIGAGCVLYQDLVRISKDAKEGKFAKNPAFGQAFLHVKTHNSTLHIMGLLSPGGVHSHEDHFIEMINAAGAKGISTIVLHCFMDGRDSSRTGGQNSLERLEKHIAGIKGVHIATIIGRYFSMDRDTNWDRTDKAYHAIFDGKAAFIYDATNKPSAKIKEWYSQEVFDELLEPQVFLREDGKPATVNQNDAIIFTNFRPDRAKQLSKKIIAVLKDKNLCFVTMTKYDRDIESIVAYEPEKIEQTVGSVIAANGLKQAHIAETEKFPHVTYFVNGGRQDPHEGEEHVLVPSRKDIKTHDEAPEMKAKEICDEAIKRLDSVDFVFLNFANPDMVGHTAKPAAIKIAVETVDTQLGRLVDAVLKRDGALVVIADHGNAEQMVDPVTGEPHTSHTTNPVPCIFIHKTYHPKLVRGGGLKDIAPTVLDLLNLDKPPCMTGQSLLS
ncbi:MAG: 2,3-bisphosphoglycerate-independent phosphoglycerate mutase [Candidatus Woesebacteria bacterium]